MAAIRSEMATEISLPYEIRRLIFDNVDGTDDLETLKSLRLVSKSWAFTGFEFLLRGTFAIKSDSDIDRLENVTSDPKWSFQSAKQINTIQIQSSHSSFSAIRHKILERSCAPSPSAGPRYSQRDERDMLHELAEADNKRVSHSGGLNRLDVLIAAFNQLPRVDTIDFALPNPFKHAELRKLWRETFMEDYQTQPNDIWYTHLRNVLFAAREAKLDLQYFIYTQLPSSLFTSLKVDMRNEMWTLLSNIKSLSLTINDGHNKAGSRSISRRNAAAHMLYQLLSSLPRLESLFIQFTLVQHVPISFWPTTMEGRLHSLCLVEIDVRSTELCSFLDLHKTTLRRLSLGSVHVKDSNLTCRQFVEGLKAHFHDFMLEKFELCGAMFSSVPRDDAWFTPSIYTKAWEDVVQEEWANSNAKTKMLEDFVLRDGPWPMTDEDDLSYFTRF